MINRWDAGHHLEILVMLKVFSHRHGGLKTGISTELLKLLVINRKGTFIDGLKISDVTINVFNLDYRSNIRFKLGVDENATHKGGLTLFGKSFGNYGQDINVAISYTPMTEDEI